MYDKLKELMDKRGISAYRMCKDTGIPLSCVTGWKHGTYEIGKRNMKKLCDYFKVPRSYFYKD